MPTVPLLPGSGVGNDLQWSDVGFLPKSTADYETLAWDAFTNYLAQNQDLLGDVNMAEIADNHRIAVHGDGDLEQAL